MNAEVKFQGNDSEFLERFQKINLCLKSVQIAFGAVIYFDDPGSEKSRLSIQNFVDEFIAIFGDDFASFRIDGTAHEWTGKNKSRQFSTLKKKLNRLGLYREYTFHFSREDAYDTPMKFGIFTGVSLFDKKKSFCGFVIPIEQWLEKKEEVGVLFTNTCDVLKADQGHGGLAITDRSNYYFDGTAWSDDQRIHEIQSLIHSSPIVDLLSSDMRIGDLSIPNRNANLNLSTGVLESLPVHEPWGLRWPSLLNFWGSEWLKKMDNFGLIKKELKGLNVEKRQV